MATSIGHGMNTVAPPRGCLPVSRPGRWGTASTTRTPGAARPQGRVKLRCTPASSTNFQALRARLRGPRPVVPAGLDARWRLALGSVEGLFFAATATAAVRDISCWGWPPPSAAPSARRARRAWRRDDAPAHGAAAAPAAPAPAGARHRAPAPHCSPSAANAATASAQMSDSPQRSRQWFRGCLRPLPAPR